MDTKSRSYSHSNLLNVFAFILVVVSFTSMVMFSFKTVTESNVNLFDSPFEQDYYSSVSYGRELTDVVHDLTSIIEDYKSEDNIKAGKSIDKDELEREIRTLFEEYMNNSVDIDQGLSYEENYKNLKTPFEYEYKEKIEDAKDKLIKEDLRNFNKTIARLKANKGIIYYGKQGDTVFSNTEKNSGSDFKEYKAYLVSEGSNFSFYPKSFENSRNYNWVYGDISESISQDRQIYVAFTDDYINQKLDIWNQSRNTIKDAIYILLALSLILLISLIYLTLVTGRRSFKDREVRMSRIDKLYTDINAILILTITPIWAVIVAQIVDSSMNNSVNNLSLIVIGVISATACSLVLLLLMSLVRHMKDKTIFTHSIIFTLGKKLCLVVKDIYDSGSLAVKVAIVVIVYPLIAAATFFMFPVTIALAVWLAHRKVKEYQEIKTGVEKIKNGEIDHKIEITNDGEFKDLSIDINSIGEGFNSAIENELKSERLKSELITNVSHDLRTPLTSIITYVDLLKREQNQEKAREYIEIIEQKSHRLKTLTDDLFEASKASSGNIPVNYEKIDIVSLITQGLGELDSQVKVSKLDFIINSREKIYVRADGRLLWRSIENLLTNIFKYALSGSRVYIDIFDLGGEIELSIKNISAYELNISSDELMERFKRGDESRNSEGSGLGLSISKSLIEAQQGKFDIIIDGDLFKVVILISKFN